MQTLTKYQAIIADDNLANIKSTALQNRFSNWQVKFRGLTIYCHDLSSFYMAAKDIFLHRIYDFKTSNPSPRVIDGGGHIGLFTLFVKQKYPEAQITIFEPDDESLQLLQQNTEANGIKGVTIVKAGLYKYNGEVPFGSDHSDGSSIFAGQKTTSIKVVRLSEYTNSPIDFLKLNVEGVELDVMSELEPNKLSLIKEMVIEYHGFPAIGQKLHKILAILDRAGFRYMIHDFDAETNSATKPPFRLNEKKRFFLLIYAKKLFPAKAQTSEHNLDERTEPISRLFGFDRGIPIDRYYIENFLKQNSSYIRGCILEIGDNSYTKKFGSGVIHSDVLNVSPSPNTTIVGDLASGKNIPESAFDCMIMTQTIQMIYEVKSALKNATRALKPGGTLLITASGISQISRFDMDRWGEYWRFTDKSLKTLLSELAPEENIHVESFGNVAVAKAFLDGLALHEVPSEVLDYKDNDYQVVLTARVDKPRITTDRKTSINQNRSTETSFTNPRILLYHRVWDDPIDAQLLAVSVENFEAHLKQLAENYRALPLYELLEELKRGEFQSDTVALTFDDGYLDILVTAVPLLAKYGLHATVFVTSGMLGSEREFWWDTLERVFLIGHSLPETLKINVLDRTKVWELNTPRDRLKAHDELWTLLKSQPPEKIYQSIEDLLEWAGLEQTGRPTHRVLNPDQLKLLAASPSIEIGSHTVTHPKLSVLSPEQQRQEIRESKQQLEAILKKPVRLFSYPYGSSADFMTETARIVAEEGYHAGIANIQGNVVPPVDFYAIPRRLVRNWPLELFSTWLKEENKSKLERETVSNRTHKLLQYSSTNRGQSSREIAGMTSIIAFNDLQIGQRVKAKVKVGEDGTPVTSEISLDNSMKALSNQAVITGLIQDIDHQKNTMRLRNREIALPDCIEVIDLQRNFIDVKGLKAGDRVKLKGKYSEHNGFMPEKIKMKQSKDFDIVELEGAINKIDRKKKTFDLIGFTVNVPS